MSFLFTLVHTIDWNGTSARLIQVLQAAGPEHLRWVRLASVLLRIDVIGGREGALRCGELCSGGTKGRQLRSTPLAKVRQGLLDLADAITQL